MNTYIALFRGINVGGNNLLPMKGLVSLLEKLGLKNVKTYIQSGNVAFQSKATKILTLSDRIGEAVQKSYGFKPRVLILGIREIERAIASNPFPEAEKEEKTLHLNFLATPAINPNLAALESIKKKTERYKLTNSIFYLHAPDGIGRSKLAANAEKLLGVPMTGRNWRTVCKIVTMAKSCD